LAALADASSVPAMTARFDASAAFVNWILASAASRRASMCWLSSVRRGLSLHAAWISSARTAKTMVVLAVAAARGRSTAKP
jgi:predicted LPLAT superfamily acyltransferase